MAAWATEALAIARERPDNRNTKRALNSLGQLALECHNAVEASHYYVQFGAAFAW